MKKITVNFIFGTCILLVLWCYEILGIYAFTFFNEWDDKTKAPAVAIGIVGTLIVLTYTFFYIEYVKDKFKK